MAVYNEILVGRLNRYLQKLLQMKGEAPAPQLSAEIQTSLQLDAGVENRYLQAWNKFGVVADIAAGGAGTSSGFRLRNPSGSNVVGVVEFLTVGSTVTAAYDVQYGQPNTDLLTSLATSRRALDGRNASAGGALVATQGTPVGSGQIGSTIHRNPGNQGFTDQLIIDPDQQIVLTPGDCLAVVETSLNLRIVVSAWYRERFLEESERT